MVVGITGMIVMATGLCIALGWLLGNDFLINIIRDVPDDGQHGRRVFPCRCLFAVVP